MIYEKSFFYITRTIVSHFSAWGILPKDLKRNKNDYILLNPRDLLSNALSKLKNLLYLVRSNSLFITLFLNHTLNME